MILTVLQEALETWNDENNELAMSKEQLVGYKDIVGESLAVDLLVYFTEKEEPEFSRRWVGLLLVELLEDSRTNRQRVWKMPEETLYGVELHFFWVLGPLLMIGLIVIVRISEKLLPLGLIGCSRLFLARSFGK